MARSLRRLVAGAVVAGSLVSLAPPAQATVRCYDVEIRGRIYHVCV